MGDKRRIRKTRSYLYGGILTGKAGNYRISENNMAGRYEQRLYRSTAFDKEKRILLYYVRRGRNRI